MNIKMATLVASYEKIRFTILPDSINAEFQDDLVKNGGRQVIGYVIRDNNTSDFKFIYTKPEEVTESKVHWSLDIIKKLPYCEGIDTWIVFNCPPHKTKEAYQHILYGEAIHIHRWDTWSIEGDDTKVAVITSLQFR